MLISPNNSPVASFCCPHHIMGSGHSLEVWHVSFVVVAANCLFSRLLSEGISLSPIASDPKRTVLKILIETSQLLACPSDSRD